MVYEEVTATAQHDKQEAFFKYFDGLLGTAVSRASTLNLEFFHWEGLDLSALDAPITEEEVWLTIKDLLADKAPGPDGYTGVSVSLAGHRLRQISWLQSICYSKEMLETFGY